MLSQRVLQMLQATTAHYTACNMKQFVCNWQLAAVSRQHSWRCVELAPAFVVGGMLQLKLTTHHTLRPMAESVALGADLNHFVRATSALDKFYCLQSARNVCFVAKSKPPAPRGCTHLGL